MLASNVQSRINEALSKIGTENTEPVLRPPATTTATKFPLVPPPLTPATQPITFVSKGSSSNHPQYFLPHPPLQKKRGVVITKLSGPLSSALSHAGELKSREGSRHSSTSSLKSGDDPSFVIQSVKNADAGVSSSHAIMLSPSPAASLDEQSGVPSSNQQRPQTTDHSSDKESDSKL